MHDLGADAVVRMHCRSADIREIRHPAAAAERDHVLFIDVFEPVVSTRITVRSTTPPPCAKLDR